MNRAGRLFCLECPSDASLTNELPAFPAVEQGQQTRFELVVIQILGRGTIITI